VKCDVIALRRHDGEGRAAQCSEVHIMMLEERGEKRADLNRDFQRGIVQRVQISQVPSTAV
jgi:hypothetical protein